MDKRHFNLLILVFILVGALAGAWVLRTGNSQKPEQAFAAPLITEVVPSPAPQAKQDETNSTVLSPNGKMLLKMTKKTIQNSNVWKITANDKEIFNATLPSEVNIELPFNAFSPDNKYIFLKETVGGMKSYPVLSTSGAPLGADGSSMIEFSSLFAQKYPDFKIVDVTGWGGVNLIVFNTDKAEGGSGPSFWFEVPTHAFIRLSTKFY